MNCVRINRCMEDLANHYATVIIPARAGKLRDKSAVENHVKIIYTQVFAKFQKSVECINKNTGEFIANRALGNLNRLCLKLRLRIMA
ncbi:hypothetical protein D7322_08530 [Sphingobacterium puteale]|uniref:Transposase n=1 Tax=Sphingobacterium puteale TaxID=2420510 RepID=A0A420W0N1_9SPHI|nr:hypothetical protein [Sphingobacterium puteale]RKO72126.1 hypothetical protein D7322_08530 [Sphingobacterium puteale]